MRSDTSVLRRKRSVLKVLSVFDPISQWWWRILHNIAIALGICNN